MLKAVNKAGLGLAGVAGSVGVLTRAPEVHSANADEQQADIHGD